MKRKGGAEMQHELLPSKKNHLSLKHKVFDYLLLSLLIFLSFQLSGCMMLIGYGVGAIADASSKKYYPINGETEFILPKPGTNITLHLKSGEEIKGKYISFVSVPSKGYADLYARAKDLIKDEVVLPALAEKITIVKKTWTPRKSETSRMKEAEFLGFDYGSIRVWESGRPQPTLLSLATIQSLSDQEGHFVNMDLVRRLVSEQRVPFLSSATIRLKSEYREARIDLADIDVIEVNGRRYRTDFFLVGAIVDLLLEVIYPGFHLWFIWVLSGRPFD